MWGVGCIFVEMITGMPTFPGIRDTFDQLDKIFKLLGTPVEENWTGVTHLPNYKPHKIGNFVWNCKYDICWARVNTLCFPFVGFYRPRKLGLSFPRLYDIAEGEAISSALLQLNPDNRISSADALKHPYFNPLPKKLYELPDGKQLDYSLDKIVLIW